MVHKQPSSRKIVEIGSMRLDLHRLAMSIFNADYISRLIDIDDWQIIRLADNS